MGIRLIASDIDGTLLQNGAWQLPREIFPLIRELKKRGIFFMAASGRQYANLRRLFAPVADDISYLCENGCATFCDDELISREIMERGLGEEIIKEILAEEDAELMLSGLDTSYLLPQHESFIHLVRDVVGNNVTVVDDIFSVKEPYSKISLYNADGRLNERHFQKRFGSRCKVVTGGREWLDMVPKSAGKSTGMKKLLEHLGVDPDDVLAIGDNENDIDMLAMAGYPAAVDNALGSVKKAAKFTAPDVPQILSALLDGGWKGLHLDC